MMENSQLYIKSFGECQKILQNKDRLLGSRSFLSKSNSNFAEYYGRDQMKV